MYSIIRHIEPIVERRARNSKAILLTGPRQVGKSTLFKHLFSSANQVTFDDDLMLAQASEDVGLFLMNNPCPLMIDEVQKCPSIFNRLKIVLDNTDKLSNFYLTGSQKLQLMENVSDSLAGRISIVELEGLSLREINGVNFNRSLSERNTSRNTEPTFGRPFTAAVIPSFTPTLNGNGSTTISPMSKLIWNVT